jgi:SagB-type dehydrogenase family enzyme
MSFAPQQFIDAADFGILPMRNYANAGARSEHEIYVNILNVSNFDCGLFHYNGIERSLEFLAHPLTREQIFYLTYEQPMCAAAAVVLFVTARVDRMGHKYRNPRALRAVYLDTGHLGQTFALVTIANGLGPWQTAAYRDSEVERVLGLDGIEEISLYCLGMGVPIISPVKEITPPASLRTYAKTTFFEDF